VSPQGDVPEVDPVVILCEGAGGGRELRRPGRAACRRTRPRGRGRWWCPVSRPDERPELDHAAAAADHVLALIVAADPTFRATPERHDAMVALVQAVARAVAAGGAR
jgi:hypothetical protein